MSKFQEKLKLQREVEETARAGLKWSPEEESNILNWLANGKSMLEVARELQRTEGSIRTRLFTLICKKVDAGEALESFYCNEYNVSSDDINTFRQEKKEREEKMQNRLQKKRENVVVSQRTMAEDLYSLKRDVLMIKRHLKI